MSAFEFIAERRIEQGQRAGKFDNLDGHGEPLPDLDDNRPVGWWAARWISSERESERFKRISAEVRSDVNRIFAMDSPADAISHIVAVNVKVSEYNRTLRNHEVERLDGAELMRLWRSVRTQRKQRRT